MIEYSGSLFNFAIITKLPTTLFRYLYRKLSIGCMISGKPYLINHLVVNSISNLIILENFVVLNVNSGFKLLLHLFFFI